jgi:hypothetical protein
MNAKYTSMKRYGKHITRTFCGRPKRSGGFRNCPGIVGARSNVLPGSLACCCSSSVPD